MTDEKIAAAKMGVGAAGVAIFGFTLNEWVAICTIIYFILQIGLLLPKYWALMCHRKKKVQLEQAENVNE